MVSMPVPGTAERESFNFEVGSQIAKDVLVKTLKVPFPSHTLVNVNIPNIPLSEVKGIEIARQGFRHYKSEVTQGLDPRGKKYFWVGGPYRGFEKSEASDCHAVQEKYVSVTPLTIDCTHNEFYATLKRTFPKGVS
jgi:5'-nucleotidase